MTPRRALLLTVVLLSAAFARAEEVVDPGVRAAVSQAFIAGTAVRTAIPAGTAAPASFETIVKGAEVVQSGGTKEQDDKAFRQSVLDAAEGLKVAADARDAVVRLYLKRRATGLRAQSGSAPDDAAALARAAQLSRRVGGTKDPFGPARDPGATGGAGLSVAGVPSGRTVEGALADARAAGDPRITLRPAAAPPSVADRLRASAGEDERILQLGADDGTWSTAVGRSVTQVKKGASGFLSFLVDGDTWKRTGSAAVDLASNPGDTVRFLPGGILEGGRALWHGVKADISTASGELSEFIDHPTPYGAVATLGATAAAVSNAFVGAGSGAKTVARQAAREELAVGVRSAREYSRALIGAADDLDFTARATPVRDAISTQYNQFTTLSRSEKAPAATGLTGRIGVPEERFAKIDQLKRQRMSDCARYGMTSCAIANGRDLTLGQVKDASAGVLVDNARADVTRLEDLSRTRGGAQLEAKLAAARDHLKTMEFFPSTSGLGVGDIQATLDRLGTPYRSLAFDSQALAAVRSGDEATFRAANAEMRRKIDLELTRGNAVMAAVYTGVKDSAHTQHALTVLGKGRAEGGGIVYQVFDSNVGRVSLMPASDLTAYGGVVVGRL
jgi:hypothetical protein